MFKKNTSWLKFIDSIQEKALSAPGFMLDEAEQLINIRQLTTSVLDHTLPCMYLLDYTTGKYSFVSNPLISLLGYETGDFLNGGLTFTLENYQRDHLRLYNEQIFPDRLAALKQIPFDEHPNYIFTYNFHFKTRTGEYINLLQKNCFLKSDENKNPLLSFGTITNVDHYKSETSILQLIEKVDYKNPMKGMETLLKKSYFFNKEDSLFTRREKEILFHLADGLNSNEIADKLFISEHTVINHRRNMMLKTDSRNVSHLVSYAVRNAII